MSHGIWVQQTPWMVYNMQSYNNVPFGMDVQMVSPGRCLMACICSITVFLVAWMHNPFTMIYNPFTMIYNQFTINYEAIYNQLQLITTNYNHFYDNLHSFTTATIIKYNYFNNHLQYHCKRILSTVHNGLLTEADGLLTKVQAISGRTHPSRSSILFFLDLLLGEL